MQARGGLAITDDHVELAATVRRWIDARAPLEVARTLIDAEVESLPPWWDELAGNGWLGLAVSEANGGQGYGVAELAIVAEQFGAAGVPGPFLPTAVAATAVDRWGTDPSQAALLASGAPAGIHVGPLVLGGGVAEWVLIDEGAGGCGLLGADGLGLVPRRSLDATRRLASTTTVLTPPPGSGSSRIADLFALVASAEAVGIAEWCLRTAATYAADRVQFGRPIGQFQAVKHRCADMAVATEAARASVWDAVSCAFDDDQPGWRVALDAAVSLAAATAFRCAKDCIQVLGGIGYTWEHDAHIYLKRAASMHHLIGAGSDQRRRLVDAVRAGESRPAAVQLPPEADAHREHARAFVEELGGLDRAEWNSVIAERGYLVPHWPTPWGLDAEPLQQLAIDAEFTEARVRRRHLQVAGWVLPTLVAHGTPAQQERWILPSLRGDIMWCQMFSEPGAGSDLASLSTSATRTEDPDRGAGWLINGQKVWTSLAKQAQWAICLARTDPAAPKHEGIGCFMLDMTTPGIDIRPLRELTGMAMFNEIFLSDVFVPDDCLIGSPTNGWACARTTLANERVSMGAGSSFGPGVQAVLDLAVRRGAIDDPLVVDEIGSLFATAHAVAMLGVRTTLRALGGRGSAATGKGSGQPGPEASVRKLLGVEHEQRVQEVGLGLLGADAAVDEDDGAAWIAGFLGNRALSIAGGSSEIQRNVIAERLLGLPKDP